jgi:biotin synthase
MDFQKLATRIIDGYQIDKDEALNLLQTPDCDFFELLSGAWLIRKKYFSNTVHLCTICNAKSGKCSEDCSFCSQSAHNPKCEVPVYSLLSKEKLQAGADYAITNGINRYSLVTSGRGLNKPDIAAIAEAIGEISDKDVAYCCSLGILDDADFKTLKAAGLNRYHHNLESSRSHFPTICTTHTYDDRIETIKKAQAAGMTICAGGLFGLGETNEQRVEMAMDLRDLNVDSVPVNFLTAIEGTAFEGEQNLTPIQCLKIIAMLRYLLPQKDILLCGGRIGNLGDLHSMIFHAGCSGMMTGNYLTTAGRTAKEDLQMIKDLGLTIRAN